MRLAKHPFLNRVGPDILDPKLTANTSSSASSQPTFRNRALGGLYLDQAFLAGIGNYLRSEILWAAQVDPQFRPAQLECRSAFARSHGNACYQPALVPNPRRNRAAEAGARTQSAGHELPAIPFPGIWPGRARMLRVRCDSRAQHDGQPQPVCLPDLSVKLADVDAPVGAAEDAEYGGTGRILEAR